MAFIRCQYTNDYLLTTNLNLKVRGQACGDDCTEEKVWVGKLDGNTEGCVYYDTAYTPKSTTWW